MTFVDRLMRRATRSRRLVLGSALAAGVVCAMTLGGGTSARIERSLIADAMAADQVRIRVAAEGQDAAAAAKDEAADTPAKGPPGVDAEITIGESGIRIRKNRDAVDPHVVVGDLEFDSFEQFVEKAPWLAALVFMVTALVFLMPLLIIVLVIWYKVRSNRMRNETMLKLAERGVVPPGEALAAMETAASTTTFASMPSTAPLYEQVKQVRKRAAWSDLRKGVIMLGIGVGLTLWSMIEEGSANGFALVLLFVGIGFVVLWYFEDRQVASPREPAPRPPGGA